MELIGENRAFGGRHLRYTHKAETTQCDMTFAIFLPPFASKEKPVPVLYWLSGLTCTDQNFMQKAGAMKLAAELGMAIVAPDTSPRGEGVPDDDEGSYDFGLGAGFYVTLLKHRGIRIITCITTLLMNCLRLLKVSSLLLKSEPLVAILWGGTVP